MRGTIPAAAKVDRDDLLSCKHSQGTTSSGHLPQLLKQPSEIILRHLFHLRSYYLISFNNFPHFCYQCLGVRSHFYWRSHLPKK
ncbi:MAG: hypothetical protein SAK42_13195 [Oscillatoria sp. PMC 1076.18]|nr:hypothetical protein [Oscillatoria sp. PMC 1076.18]